MTNSRPPRSHKFGRIGYEHVDHGKTIFCAQCNKELPKIEWNRLNEIRPAHCVRSNLMKCPECGAMGHISEVKSELNNQKKYKLQGQNREYKLKNGPRVIDLQLGGSYKEDKIKHKNLVPEVRLTSSDLKTISNIKNEGFNELMKDPAFRLAQMKSVKVNGPKLGPVSERPSCVEPIGGMDEQKESEIIPPNPKSPIHSHPPNAWQKFGRR